MSCEQVGVRRVEGGAARVDLCETAVFESLLQGQAFHFTQNNPLDSGKQFGLPPQKCLWGIGLV